MVERIDAASEIHFAKFCSRHLDKTKYFIHQNEQLEYARLLWDSEPKRPHSERSLRARRLVVSPRKASIFQLHR